MEGRDLYSLCQIAHVDIGLPAQDAAGGGAQRLSPGTGRPVPPGVLGDAANRDGGASPTRATPRLGKRKNAEVLAPSSARNRKPCSPEGTFTALRPDLR